MTSTPALRLTGYAVAGVLLVGGGAAQPVTGEAQPSTTVLASSPAIASASVAMSDGVCITCENSGQCPAPDCGGVGSDCPHCYSDVHRMSTGTCPNPECG
jgi:hypothetical protein